MSDEEEESMSEGFSASEDEWKPGKDVRGGESSDDDDSDFEKPPGGPSGSVKSSANPGAIRKREQKPASGIKGASVKKRKPMQSLRAKLYNKYRPPPKTFPTSPTNSASASGSSRVTASKNATTPNESGDQQDDVDNDDTSSDSSVDDYLVNPEDLDLHSSFFTSAGINDEQQKEKSPAPVFDCNAGVANLSDSGSEDNNDSSLDDNAKTKAFDFRNLLENANSLERAKETLAKRAAVKELHDNTEIAVNSSALDVNALLALGENQNYATNTESQTIDDGPSKLSKTKSTRVKRHTKTRPASTIVAGGDTDDSDWEEVAGAKQNDDHNESQPDGDSTAISELSRDGNLEIHVDLPTRQPRTNQEKTKEELEMAFKRRLNRDLKDRQLELHKISLLCMFARSYRYNKLINDTSLMQAALKLLPSKNAYPTERGTELKYFQSFITWFKTVIKLNSPNLYPEKCAKTKNGIIDELHGLIKRKEARCKQDMVFLFIILARAMGMHCRLVVNLQPLPLRPSPNDLLPIKLKKDTNENASNKAQVQSSDKRENVKKDVKVSTITLSKSNSNSSDIKPKIEKAESQIKNGKETTNDSKNKKNFTNTKDKDEEVGAIEMKLVNSRTSRKDKDTEKNKEATSRNRSTSETKAKPTLSKLKKSQTLKIDEVQERSTTKNSRGKETAESSKRTGSERSNSETKAKPSLSRLKRSQPIATKVYESNSSDDNETVKKSKVLRQTSLTVEAAVTPIARRTRKASTELKKAEQKERIPSIRIGSPVVPRIVLHAGKEVGISKTKTENENAQPSVSTGDTRSRSKSPKMQISTAFLHTKNHQDKKTVAETKLKSNPTSSESTKLQISPNFLSAKNVKSNTEAVPTKRVLRTRQQRATATTSTNNSIPQLDGGDDNIAAPSKKRPKLEKLQKSRSKEGSDDDFEPSPTKRVKKAPMLPKAVQNLRKDRRVLSTDDEVGSEDAKTKRKATASDMWVEIFSDVEEQWICVDLFKGKLHCVDTIRKAASSNLAYVFAFQNDLSLKDVTARYCPNWTTTVRKSRVEKSWLDEAIAPYLAVRSKREIREDQELRRIHEEKPLPTSITDFKDHPLYALERHLLKFQAIYPPDAPTLGFIRGEAIYSRDCVHVLHSREIWVKQARVVKLGEQPYKIVKARPKWDRLTQTVIKDQPLEIFGYWQTEDYDPPTAENGIVPRNAYGNVELFKACMLPKKTAHLRLPGLNRICKKLNIDCANAVVGFDFHQGACHPTFDGFIVCEEFVDQVTAAWYQDQEDQDRKDQEKYEARVYGNWKKLIKGLLIRERLKKKYNF